MASAVEFPLVTTVVPLHNHSAYILDCLESLSDQIYPRQQIVVVDDGSTDGSAQKVCDVLAKWSILSGEQGEPWAVQGTFHGIPLMLARFEKARGPAFARNYGIRAGWEGTALFALLDSDDMYEPTKISRSVEEWQKDHVSCGVVYSDYTTFTNDGRLIREYKQSFNRNDLLRACMVNVDSLISKTAFEKCGLFDESYRVAEDLQLWYRISREFTFTHIPESLLKIRVGPHSSTHTVDWSVWQNSWQRIAEENGLVQAG